MITADSSSITGLLRCVMHEYITHSHEQFEHLPVYRGQPPLLLSLFEKDGQSQSSLATKLKLKASTVTVMISRLQKSGLVHKDVDSNDKRVSHIFLTEKGRSVCEELIKIHLLNEEVYTKNLSIEEKIILKRLLLQILDNITTSTHYTQKGDD